MLANIRIRLGVFLGQVDAFYEHALIVKNLQHRTAPAFVLAGRNDNFVAFSDLVHSLYRDNRVLREPQVPAK